MELLWRPFWTVLRQTSVDFGVSQLFHALSFCLYTIVSSLQDAIEQSQL